MATSVDFAARLINPQSIKDAGHSAVMVYVSPSRPGSNFGAKPITKAYADECKRVGLELISVWQFGKPNGTAPSDWTTGYDGGHRMALQARDTHFAVGGAGFSPIFFAVDEDITINQWNQTAVEFFRGAGDAIGREWVGVYGSSKVCSWAIEDNVIGGKTGARWAWQTRAWSNNEREPQAVLFQRVIDTPSSPGPVIDGSSVDVNDILATDYGQWSINRTSAPPKEVTLPNKPNFTELDRRGNSNSNRGGTRVTNFLLHTEEGNSTAESLAVYLNNPSHDASYHYTLRDGVVCDVVSTNLSSWSVLSANPFTINLCFAGSRASWSREQWLNIELDISIAAWIAVRDAKAFGFSTEVIAPPYHRADGISDHKYVTQCLGIGSHTDVGNGFPWDVFANYVHLYDGTAPVVNEIDEKAAQSPWLGERITKGENVCPDGVGRFAEFANGHIYWTPTLGAHPIPKSLFTKYATLGFETGVLGYPALDNVGVAGGEVEAFIGGSLYHQDGKDVFVVLGAIGDAWARLGFEKSAVGWPVSDEYANNTGRAQDFEHGTLYWDPSGVVLVTKV